MASHDTMHASFYFPRLSMNPSNSSKGYIDPVIPMVIAIAALVLASVALLRVIVDDQRWDEVKTARAAYWAQQVSHAPEQDRAMTIFVRSRIENQVCVNEPKIDLHQSPAQIRAVVVRRERDCLAVLVGEMKTYRGDDQMDVVRSIWKKLR